MKWTHPGDVCDRSGAYAYVHMIRSPQDPERRPRWSELPTRNRPTRARWEADKKRVRDQPAAWWREKILGVVRAVKKPLTFNAIGVMIADVTADMAPDAAEDALWQLVADGVLVHTLAAPIVFKLSGRRPAPKTKIAMNLF